VLSGSSPRHVKTSGFSSGSLVIGLWSGSKLSFGLCGDVVELDLVWNHTHLGRFSFLCEESSNN
jgi:hypothetical protein